MMQTCVSKNIFPSIFLIVVKPTNKIGVCYMADCF
jgi:hypothetical protein